MAEATEKPKKSMKRMGLTRRKSVKVELGKMTEKRFLSPDQPMPLVIEPVAEKVDALSWAEHQRESIGEDLRRYGAILFRGFDLADGEDFDRFSRVIIPHRVNYVEGSSPRVATSDKVYTSTEYPADQFVSMHNELSYAHQWPSELMFFCQTEPESGGETPIADSRLVLEQLGDDLRRRFSEKGVRYTRHLHGGRGAGLSWQTVFETEERQVVEDYCRAGEIRFSWTEDGGLRTEQWRPAVRRHEVTGEEIWFNQVDQWHPTNLEPEVARALLANTAEEDLPIYATYGDGTPFEDAELDEIRQVFDRVMVRFPWQRGDALLVDNMLVAHGRMPFTGNRRVLVAMGSMTA